MPQGRGVLALRRWTVAAAVAGAGLAVLMARAGNPDTIDPLIRLRRPSGTHLLGTDHLGRDVLSRLLHGGALTLGLATVALVGCLVIGTAAGAIAGRQPRVARLVLRLVDLMVAVPAEIAGLALAVVLTPGTRSLLVALLVTGWAPFARLTHGLTRKIGMSDYVIAAEAVGASASRILLRHVLPNAARPLVAHACLRYANVVLMIAGLSFLGLGAQPPTAEWGVMLSQAQPYLERAPLLVIAPGTAIVAVALAAIAFGRWLERRLL